MPPPPTDGTSTVGVGSIFTGSESFDPDVITSVAVVSRVSVNVFVGLKNWIEVGSTTGVAGAGR
jgi:hypothetical protein